ncbi:unnamed protein product [Symbiodinium natans]|uniref:FAD-dependent oxidoreductase domain-containing protein 1 n=1 Tax=Symbiodinium natans TaxID=878477 RepID=A0A812II97_9DINO|nr:unnamed protein product [Symbiodinium natans]
MADLRALCSACRQPLSGPLVANSCNHVFHKECLSSAETCGQCSARIWHNKALSLFNLSFADGEGDASVMKAVAELKRKREDCPDVTAVDASDDDDDFETHGNPIEEVAAMCILRERLKELRGEVQTAKWAWQTACENREKQESRRRQAQQSVEKLEATTNKLKGSIKNAWQQRDKLSEQLQQVHLRDAVLEYWEDLMKHSPAKGLETLKTYAGLVPRPARLMAQVARLRDSQRKAKDTDLAEAAKADARYDKARREIAELEEVVIGGCGVAGASAAMHLSARGAKVTIVDPRPPLTATSQFSTECYRDFFLDPALVPFMSRSVDLLEELAGEANEIGLTRRGYSFFTATDEGCEAFEAFADKASSYGAGPVRRHRDLSSYQKPTDDFRDPNLVGFDLIRGPENISSIFPFVAKEAKGLLHARRCGWLDSQGLGRSMLTKAREKDATVLRGRIAGFDVEGGDVAAARVVLSDGTEKRLPCDAVVNAGGAWMSGISALLGRGSPLPLVNEVHAKVILHDTKAVIPQTLAPFMVWRDKVTLDWDDEVKQGLLEMDDTAEGGTVNASAWIGEQPGGQHLRPAGNGWIVMLWEHLHKHLPIAKVSGTLPGWAAADGANAGTVRGPAGPGHRRGWRILHQHPGRTPAHRPTWLPQLLRVWWHGNLRLDGLPCSRGACGHARHAGGAPQLCVSLQLAARCCQG